MASTWDIISSSVVLVIFLAVVFAAIKIAQSISASTSATQSNLASKGVTYESGRLKVQTDMAAPSREEYIASTQRAFERGAKQMSLHPEAFRTGPSRQNSDEKVQLAGSASGVETPDKKSSGFKRSKKLA